MLKAREPRAESSQTGRLPYLFDTGFQNIGAIPCIAIWELVRYETVCSGTRRSWASGSNAGMIPAAVKVVMKAKEDTSRRLMFFFNSSILRQRAYCGIVGVRLTFHGDQFRGSPGSIDGIGSRSKVPCT